MRSNPFFVQTGKLGSFMGKTYRTQIQIKFNQLRRLLSYLMCENVSNLPENVQFVSPKLINLQRKEQLHCIRMDSTAATSYIGQSNFLKSYLMESNI